MIKKLNQTIENHYLKEGLYEDICQRLLTKGVDLQGVTREDIAGVDEFHVRGAAVSNELANSIDLTHAKVLDVGSGLGGPCRMLADQYDCETVGIDLSTEYVRTATALSKLVKLADNTRFIQGDALHLPFEDESFDVVWTQHVQMNIPDKYKFYLEIHRVLRPGGKFLYYDIFKKGNEPTSYPMPWATTIGESFLFKTADFQNILADLGFSEIQTSDQTKLGVDFFKNLVAKIKESGPPKIGLNVLMGETTQPKLMNLMSHLIEGKLSLQSGVYQKPILPN